MRLTLLFITCLLAVGLSVGMWLTGEVAFDTWTFSLHVVSIYIGVSGVLIAQSYLNRTERKV